MSERGQEGPEGEYFLCSPMATTSDEAEIKAALEAKPIRLVSKAGGGGRLFGSIGGADVAEAVSAAGGPALDKRKVTLPAPIKSVGTHTATVALTPEVSATVTLEVVAAS